MATTSAATDELPLLNRSGLQHRVNALRRIDNVSNWVYVIFECVFVSTVLAVTIGCCFWRAAAGLSWFWDIPVTVVGVFLVGVAQHRLSIIGHEASHYSLFRRSRPYEV